MKLALLTTYTLLSMSASAFSEDMTFGFVAVERLERQFEPDSTLLDLQSSYGTDEHQFVTKLEGDSGDRGDRGDTEYEFQLLYGKPISAFYDFQLGLELADRGQQSMIGIVAGFVGLAPYRIELDTAVTISEDGKLFLQAEFERDFLLSQKLVLQPRIEIGAGSDADGIAIEVRTRYEVRRKFSPYIGVSWQRALGSTADRLELLGEDDQVTTLVAGISFWF